MTNVTKTRIDFIDLAKGFCIMMVVFHHYCGNDLGPYHPINMFFRSFRMPLYFILSGLFFKEYEGFWSFIKRKTNKLLIPFFFWFCLSSILFLKANSEWDLLSYLKIITTGIWHEKITGNTPIWFLWGLFLNNIIFYLFLLLSQKCSKFEIPCLILFCSLCGLLGYYMGKNDISIPLYIDTALTTIPFFAFGYFLRMYTKILLPSKYDKYLIIFIILCFSFVYIFAERPIFYSNKMQECSVVSLYSCGIMGSLGILSVSKMLHHLPIITYLGRYSIIILCTHLIPNSYLYLVMPFFEKIGFSDNLFFHFIIFLIILLLEYSILIPILKRFLPYFTAQKDLIPIHIIKTNEK